jgi:SagB-type dehydrogenase family enzyme
MNKISKNSLALEYHENTKVLLGNQHFDSRAQCKTYPSSKTIKLDKFDCSEKEQNKSDFIRTLISRKSTRAFAQDGIGLKEISQLLTLSFGLRGANVTGINLRTYSSAGARYPIEIYPVILRSDDIELGIYHYNVIDNSLELIRTGDYNKQIFEFYKNQPYISNFPCIIFFSMVFERSMEKYGERGYRFIFLDAGHMSQNLYLTAQHLDLGVVALGAGTNSDDEIDDLIGLVHKVENVFYGLAVGTPD